MKKIIYVLGLSMFLLAACANGGDADPSNTSGGGKGGSGGSDTSDTSSGDDSSSEDEPEVELEVKDGPILHAWGWSTTMVKNALPDIKKAGYKNVQLSPMQPSKNASASAYWWNIYQPQGFKVANSGQNPIGDKDSLKDLTKAADNEGINIIMDVVTNHLGGYRTGDGRVHLDENVKNYESTIYNNNLIHDQGYVGNWNNRERVVIGDIGDYPGVKTENSNVQSSIIGMLKDYIDCGVKGFRFDAAKHIETDEDDSRYKSDYWKNITNAIYTYGEQKLGVTPFVYGEVLDEPCIRYEAYTKYMSVTDNRQADKVLFGVRDRNVDNAASNGYSSGDAGKTVLWAESHDTFENKAQHTTHVSTDVLNLTYAIQISRKDATALFFARPSENYPVDEAPQVISGATGDYKSALVSAANKLHNDFVGGTETISKSNSAVVNIRKTSKNEGALIADVSCSDSTVKVNVPGLSDGEYTDLINNQKYNVQDGQVTVKLTKGGCVLEKDAVPTQKGPTISITAEETTFSSTTKIYIKVTNGENSTYKINNGSPVAFNGSTTVTVGGDISEGEIKITVNSSNSSGNSSKSLTVYKADLSDKNFVVRNVPEDVKLAVWSWEDGQAGSWTELVGTGTMRAADITRPNYTIAKFNSGDSVDWSNNKGQTDNERMNGNVSLDYDSLVFVKR